MGEYLKYTFQVAKKFKMEASTLCFPDLEDIKEWCMEVFGDAQGTKLGRKCDLCKK